jgi:hypothetical protein
VNLWSKRYSIGIAGKDFIPVYHFDFSDSLDAFQASYVNRHADHHAHEIASRLPHLTYALIQVLHRTLEAKSPEDEKYEKARKLRKKSVTFKR